MWGGWGGWWRGGRCGGGCGGRLLVAGSPVAGSQPKRWQPGSTRSCKCDPVTVEGWCGNPRRTSEPSRGPQHHHPTSRVQRGQTYCTHRTRHPGQQTGLTPATTLAPTARRGSLTGGHRCRWRSSRVTCGAAPRPPRVWTPAQGSDLSPVVGAGADRAIGLPPLGPAASVVVLRPSAGFTRPCRVTTPPLDGYWIGD